MAFHDFIRSSDSLIAKIDQSKIFKEWFQQAQQDASGQCRVIDNILRNLSAAKHRFASHTRPLGRFVLQFEALLQTAKKIMVRRGEKDNGHSQAKEFLTGITEEIYLQLAMMADAAEEVLLLLQEMDKAEVDCAKLSGRVEESQSESSTCSCRGGCVKVTHGYTTYALEVLRQARTWTAGGGG